jgi:protein-S-isoprenylcysteine O-methyltransferase Ste14
MVLSHILLACSWSLYCLLHSLLAALWFKQIARRWMGRQYKFYRLYYTVFAFAGLVAIMIYLFTMSSYRLFAISTATIIMGSVIAAFGLIIMFICILKYFMQLSGIKGLIENRTNNELMITGIHKIVRHPLYAGTFIFIWGLLILFPYLSLFIVNIIVTVYTLIGLHFEEQKLEKEFGEAYKAYKQKVPMLIPKLNSRSNKSYQSSTT